MDAMNTLSFIRGATALAGALLLCQCSLLDRVVNSSAVIYALPPQQTMPSPLASPSTLSQVGPTISFAPNRFLLTARQRTMLQAQAAVWKEKPPQLLILGFTRRGIPAGYARSLAQRRAESVRQVLIEEGIDAAHLHSAGYGHDQPGLSNEDAVKLFVAP
jgi:outer membrane protein OmpA-like peptidoglycan-associated protein